MKQRKPEQGMDIKANINTLARFDGWRILYKLSLSAYLFHYLVVFWFFASTQSNGQMLSMWLIFRVQYGTIMVSFFFGLCFYLLVDKPVRNLDRLVLFPSKISDSFLIKKTQHTNNRLTLKK